MQHMTPVTGPASMCTCPLTTRSVPLQLATADTQPTVSPPTLPAPRGSCCGAAAAAWTASASAGAASPLAAPPFAWLGPAGQPSKSALHQGLASKGATESLLWQTPPTHAHVPVSDLRRQEAGRNTHVHELRCTARPWHPQKANTVSTPALLFADSLGLCTDMSSAEHRCAHRRWVHPSSRLLVKDLGPVSSTCLVGVLEPGRHGLCGALMWVFSSFGSKLPESHLRPRSPTLCLPGSKTKTRTPDVAPMSFAVHAMLDKAADTMLCVWLECCATSEADGSLVPAGRKPRPQASLV